MYVRPIHVLLDPLSQCIVAYRTGADFLLSLDLIFIILTGSVEVYDFLFLTLRVVRCLWFNSGHCRLIGKKVRPLVVMSEFNLHEKKKSPKSSISPLQ